jgi:PAS domain S-box-containing protein
MATAENSTRLLALLVEDSEIDAELLLRELHKAGFQVTSRRVQTAADFKAALAEATWDIVLSDYKMPEFNGMEALAIVKAAGLDLPFILISGAIGEEIAVEAMRGGANDYFVKRSLARIGPAITRELREAAGRRAFRASEARVRQLSHAVEQAPVSFVITDVQGAIEYVNPKFTAMTGYSLEEARGQNPRLLKSGNQSPEFYAELWRTILAGGEWHGELQNRAKDGTLFWELASISAIRDENGRVTHYFAAKLDITERMTAMRKIEEQAALLNLTNDAIYVRTLDGRIRFWSRGAERVYGWKREEAEGRKLAELRIQELVGEAERDGWLLRDGSWSGERRQMTKKDEPVVVFSSLTLVKDERGQPNAVLANNTDITEKKKMEDQFLRAQRLESIGMLAAGIAHDLNNVLAPILMGAPLLAEVATKESDRRLLKTMEASAERGAGLVRQILGFAHGIGGEPQLVQVKHVLRDIAGIIRETFSKSIVFEDVIPKELWPVQANPTQIHQVLLNLCVNARDAMPAGGQLRIVAENLFLNEEESARIEGMRPGAWIGLHVTDSGTGMPPDVLARIWEPFFTTKSASKGTGLGLPTVRGIVTQHRGVVSAESTVGRGSTFHVYLPAAESAAVGPTAPVGGSAPRGAGELILLVDDEETIRAAGSAILTAHGYRVITAGDGSEGVAAFSAHADEIALVITDLDMPNLNGAGLARTLHHLKPDLKILAWSGLGGTSGDTSVRPAEFAAAFLMKPFAVTTLLKLIRHLLGTDRTAG